MHDKVVSSCGILLQISHRSQGIPLHEIPHDEMVKIPKLAEDSQNWKIYHTKYLEVAATKNLLSVVAGWEFVKSGSTPVGGLVKSGQRWTKDKGRGLDKRLVQPVEVAHAPGVNCRRSAHKTATHISVDLVIVLFRVDVTCHTSHVTVTRHNVCSI